MSHLNFRSKRRLFCAIFKHFVVLGKYKKCQAPLVVSAMKGPTLMGFFSIKMKKGKEVILSSFSRQTDQFCTRFTDSHLKSTRAAALLASKVNEQFLSFFNSMRKSFPLHFAGVKSTAMDRGYRRMHIAPYVRPK